MDRIYKKILDQNFYNHILDGLGLEFLQRHFVRAAKYSIWQDWQKSLDQNFSNGILDGLPNIQLDRTGKKILDQNFSNDILDGLPNIPLDRTYE